MKVQSATTITAVLLATSAWAQAPEPAGSPGPAQNEEQQAPPARIRMTAPQVNAGSSQIILPAGAWVRIRVDQPLSSDRNHTGDGFTGTLAQPIVADGYIIAHRGQTIEG